MSETIEKTAPSKSAEGPGSEHYARLLQGMAHAVAAKGYAETTIADIVREAAVSRRTFYEHFSTKTECLIALYETASRLALQTVSEAFDPAQPWHAQVEQAMTAYFDYLAQDPALLRTLFVEILGLGLPGLAVRRRVNDETIGIYAATILNAPEHLILVNNKHPLVPLSTLRAGHRLVIHGLSTEMLHSLLQRMQAAQRNTGQPETTLYEQPLA